ncbi:MAG: FTR1 family iron permease [Thermoplasmatota archaeon]
MLGQYLLTFREAFEAMLLISIILAFLIKIDRKDLRREVWIGIGISLFSSLTIGVLVLIMFSGLSEAGEKLFESVAAFTAVAVLTWVILWMAFKGRYMTGEIKEKVGAQVERGTRWGLVGLVFILVFREALETLLFLTPFGVDDPVGTVAGFVLGLISAGVLSLLIYRYGVKLDIGRFFKFSSILLIFLAAGLLGYGMHELFEYFEEVGTSVGWLGATAFDLGIPGGSLFHHNGIIGSVFKVLFGYSSKMEWGMLLLHFIYLLIFLPTVIITYRRSTRSAERSTARKEKHTVPN